MTSERQHDRDRGVDDYPAASSTATAPWADLRLQVPNDRSDESIVAFVECVLVELTHEAVGAEYRSSNVFGATVDQYITADVTGQQFREPRYDERLGWFETPISRDDVRDTLVWRLSRPASLARNRNHPDPGTAPDTFQVNPRTSCERVLRVSINQQSGLLIDLVVAGELVTTLGDQCLDRPRFLFHTMPFYT